ncbi:hypothetical protein JOD02_002244 [Caldicoprobacter guelmensis]|nr:hypothetical protein [Caldicoprobacter guelmensis]
MRSKPKAPEEVIVGADARGFIGIEATNIE